MIPPVRKWDWRRRKNIRSLVGLLWFSYSAITRVVGESVGRKSQDMNMERGGSPRSG
jgi:hypothetical protein